MGKEENKMTNCYFCGSNVETMQNDDYFKDKLYEMDRYFIDKRDNKTMCKLCGIHYMQRQFFDTRNSTDADIQEFEKFVLANFQKVMVKEKSKSLSREGNCSKATEARTTQ